MKRLAITIFVLALAACAWADGPTTMINLDHTAAEINQANDTALKIRSADGVIISDGAGNILTAPTGALVPSGGTAGQVLGKSSNADYDIGWIDQTGGGGGVDGVIGSAPITVDNTDPANPVVGITSGTTVPPGGTTGQVLKKTSDTDYDTQWAADEGGGGGGTPGGEENSVQYNDGVGGFAGNANFKYDPDTGNLEVGGVTSNAPDGEHFIVPINTNDHVAPQEGYMWYNATDKTYRYYDGTQNVDVPGAGGGGGVEGVTGTAPITVDNTDPANPVIGIDGSGYAPASHVSDTANPHQVTAAQVGISSGDLVPAGGTTGQVLQKASDADGDSQWGDMPGGGNLLSDGSVPMDGGYVPQNAQDIATKDYTDQVAAGVPITCITTPTVFYEPDVLAASTEPAAGVFEVFDFSSRCFSSGATLTAVVIKTSAPCTDTVVFEEWTNDGSTWTKVGDIQSVTLSGVETVVTTLTDASIAAGNKVMLNISGMITDIDWLSGHIEYSGNSGVAQ